MMVVPGRSSVIMRRDHLYSSRRAEQLMGMAAAATSWTVEMLDALPDDGQRYELIDGELFVTLAPSRWNRRRTPNSTTA